MTLIKDAEIWFAKVDPARPNSKFNKKNPTWEVQLRTTSKEQKKTWIAQGLPVKDIVPDEGEPYFRVNLRKRTIKADGEKASPVEVVYGDKSPVDPKTIGNGSRGNVRVFQYDFDNEGTQGIANVLMGIQLTKHVRYTPKPRDDEFEETETEIVEAEEREEDDEAAETTEEVSEETTSEEEPEEEEKPKKKAPSIKPKAKVDEYD